MFRYYAKCAICYAYLSDVTADNLVGCTSEWFSRGWTLQELLAPSEVHFYNSFWEFVGLKSAWGKVLASITGIPANCLISRKAMYEASVASKMSWASRRRTTRKEDMAYCLLGIFDVNLPLLYGEGKKAFMRLQLEIIRKSDDESIFAWKYDIPGWGMLAPSPRAFETSGHVRSSKRQQALSPVSRHISPRPYTMTNKGLEMCKGLHLRSSDFGLPDYFGRQAYKNVFALVLDCYTKSDDEAELPRFQHVLVQRWDAQWIRVKCNALGVMDDEFLLKENVIPVETLFVHQPGL